MGEKQSKTDKIQSIYNLSPMQTGMLYHKMLNEDSSEYVVQSVYEFESRLDEEVARMALELLSVKYDVLRTLIFYKKSEKKRQVVLNSRVPEMTVVDVSALDEKAQLERIEELKNSDVARGFDLEQDTLLRMTVIKRKTDRYCVFWTIHHIIIDGWSTSLLFRDFIKYYSMLNDGKQKDDILRLVKLEMQQIPTYKQYIELIEKKGLSKSLEFWKEYLNEYVDIAEILPVYKMEGLDHKVNRISIPLSEELTERIKNVSKEYKVTVSTILEAVYGIVLSRYANSNDVVFGKVVSGRNVDLPGIEQAVGLFINTVPVRMQVEDLNEKFSHLITKMQQSSLQTTEHEYCPLVEIQQQTPLGNKLFNTLFVYENYFVSEDARKGQDSLNGRLVSEREETSYPITVSINGSEHFNFSMMYDAGIYTEEECVTLLKRMKQVAGAVAANVEIPVGSIELMLDEEKDLIRQFNDTDLDVDVNKTLIRYFEENARKNPERTAVKYKDTSLTYGELNHKASIVCGLLQKEGIGPGDFVGIIATRSLEMMIGIFGIVKTGAAYVPIDKNYPQERVDYILEDCKTKVVLSNCVEDITVNGPKVINLNDEKMYEGNQEAVSVYGGPEDAVYVIYTSGTTGKPKGVVNVNRGMINRILWMQNQFPLDHNDCILQKTTYTFDVSVWELFWWSITGASVCMLGQGDEKEPGKIYEEINAQDVTVMHFVPTMFNSFLNFLAEEKEKGGKLAKLRYIFASGEALTPDSVKNWLSLKPSYAATALLVNLYGPTEASIDVTYYCCDHESDVIPIGRPIQNTQLYVIQNGMLNGIGMPGELCLGGLGLARGYLNLPEMTDAKFIKNPFGEGKIYRTGDLAEWLPDGNVRYLGRIDNQVKIRGFRIELGEIEAAILGVEDVTQAAVIVRNDKSGDKAIYAYYVASRTIDVSEIREKIKQVLPTYMIPAGMMQLDKIPYTSNGKLGTKLLPDIVYNNEQCYVAPQNEMQRLIVQAFEEVLLQKKVGIKDNFFEMGGHSLKVVTLIHKLERLTEKQIPIKAVFENPTPEALASYMASNGSEAYEPLPEVEDHTDFEMYSAQKRIFVIEQMEGKSVSYHIPVAFRLHGEIDREKAEYAWQMLLKRHETLRTSFHCIDNRYVQRIHKDANGSIVWSTPKETSAKVLMKKFVRPFEDGEYPLARIEIAKAGEKDYILMLDVHHIIADGTSLNILIEEFSKLYAGMTLEDNVYQYKNFSEWMRKRDFSKQREYWKKVFEDEVPVLDLPTDYKRPEWQSFNGSRINVNFDKKLRKGIEELAVKTGTTEHIIMLAGLMVLLGAYSRQEDIVVGTPIAGRTHRDTDRMVGMFVNTLALRGYPAREKKFIDFLGEMKKSCLEAYENQEYPFEEVVEMLRLRKDVSRNPLFDVMFEMKNNEDTYSNIPGLEITYEKIDYDISKFDLSVDVSRVNEEYQVSFEYCTDLFDEQTIFYMMKHFESVLNSVIRNPEEFIKNIELCDAEEKKLLLVDFNQTALEYPKNKTVQEAFEETVAKYPDETALIFGNRKLSYAGFNNLVNREADRLRKAGVGRNEYVLLCAERGMGMLIGIFAIIKAGGAYVPIAPDYPAGRIAEILSDCKAKVVVTFKAAFPDQFDLKRVEINDEEDGCRYANPERVNESGDSLYSIFTSGTTGKPKGVMISHRNLMNLVTSYTKIYALKQTDAILCVANYVFDQSVWNFFNPILVGGTLVLISEDDVNDSEKFEKCCNENGVTILAITPTRAAILNPDHFKTVRLLETGGEAANPKVFNDWSRRGVEIYNAYGPTEATVNTSYYKYNCEDTRVIPIGKPVHNLQLYIMQEDRLCPIGVPGELYIAGDSLSAGYLGQKELTEEKFVRNPFGEGKAYKSGDLALWRYDGNVVYLGRIDEQVKIRGFRIELMEIDSLLRQMEEIKDCAVVVRKNRVGEASIYAYITSDQSLDCNEIKNRLKSNLAYYMVPSAIMQIDAIPNNRSGKLDKRALPEIKAEVREYVKPETDNEILLNEIIRQILGLDEVSMADNFFEVGGDSIKAIHVASAVRERGKELTVKDILKSESLKDIALYVREPEVVISQEEIVGEYKLTTIQKLFFSSNYPEINHYNQSLMIKTQEKIDAAILAKTFDVIVAHHDVLRSTFKDGKAVIKAIDEAKAFDIHEYDFSDTEEELLASEIAAKNNEVQEKLDIEEGLLIQVNLFHLKGESHIFMAVHHLVIDAVSWGIMCEDLEKTYFALKNGSEVKLPDKTVSFKDWSEYISRIARSDEIMGRLDKIRKVQSLVGDTLFVPSAKEAMQNGAGNVMAVSEYVADAEVTTDFITGINKKFGTHTDELLTCALGLAFKRVFGNERLAIESESHGRIEYKGDVPIERTIGWFTNVYPVILNVGYDNLSDCIISVKETIRNNQDVEKYYGILAGQEENGLGEIRPNVCFNFLGEVDSNLSSRVAFQPSEYDCGDNISPQNVDNIILGIDCYVAGRHLHVRTSYNTGRLSAEEERAVSKEFLHSFESIIALCTEDEDVIHTASDFGAKNMQKDEFDEIFAAF